MKIAVLGAGSWGMALSAHLCRGSHKVGLWEFDPGRARHLSMKRSDERILPGISLPPEVAVTHVLPEAVSGAGAVVFVVPTT
jgi:glycerol-3-phosphate dehydrogenase (NAD(P)+)